MAFRADDMGRFQFSEEDTEDLWDSPSKRKEKRAKTNNPSGDGTTTPEPKHAHDEGDTLFDREESREAALRDELQSVRNINEVIEGLLGSLDRAKGNMDVRFLSLGICYKRKGNGLTRHQRELDCIADCQFGVYAT